MIVVSASECGRVALLQKGSLLSRYRIDFSDGEHRLEVGYDPKTGMYFLQLEKDEGETLVLEKEFRTVESLVAFCKHNVACVVPFEIQHTLRRDRYSREGVPGSSAKVQKRSTSKTFNMNSIVPRNFHLVDTPMTTVYFDNMQQHFLDCIRAHDVAFCAVYSLSDQVVVDELARLRWVSVLLDKDQRSKFCNYSKLEEHRGISGYGPRCIEVRNEAGERTYSPYDDLNGFVLVDPKAGEAQRHESFHTKFCVFADVLVGEREPDINLEVTTIIPRAAWVGSYNPTPTGDHSIQSAVLLRDRDIVLAFLAEYFALHRAATNTIRTFSDDPWII